VNSPRSRGFGDFVLSRTWRVKRISTPERDDLLLARVEPPLPGEDYGNRDIEPGLLATGQNGASLFPTFGPATSEPILVRSEPSAQSH
jgi:hypothetical protein